MSLRLIVLFCGALALASCTRPGINIPEITDKTPEEVARVLGAADSMYTQKIVTKAIYTERYRREFEIEIMYLNGLSTDIVVLDAAPELPFEPSAIATFGFKAIPPTDVMKNAYIKWKNYPGYKTINCFATDLDGAGEVEKFQIFFKSDGIPNN
jgi:hypothetical protein